MLTLLRFDDRGEAGVEALLTEALSVLAGHPGCTWGCAARSPDDPRVWVLALRWDDAGTMRRGIGSYQAKVALGPLQGFAAAGSGTFEILAEQVAGGFVVSGSDRDPAADTAGPGA